MDVKQAVAAAKAHIAELFADEDITALGLEAVEFDDSHNNWLVTVGFSRDWDTYAPIGSTRSGATALQKTRSYKVVAIDDNTGRIVSVNHRAFV